MAKKGGPGKGGKGGPKGGKGGKGPGGIMECADQQVPSAGQSEGADEGAGEDIAAEEWYFDHLGSLTAVPLANRFAALEEEQQESPPPPPAPHDNCHCCPGSVSDSSRQGPSWRTVVGPTGRERRKRHVWGPLNLLLNDAAPPPESLLGAVSADTEHGTVVEVVVDSGAVHSVTPPSKFSGQVTSSPWSRAGRSYRAANGTSIKNLGQQQVTFDSDEGHRCHIPFQVANVEQPLLSVAHLASAGNQVELGPTGGRIYNVRTGREMKLVKRGGVHLLKMWVAGEPARPFRRQGA